MKAQTLIFSVFWLWCYGLPAQIPPPTFEWAKSFGGWQDDYLADMVMDDDGNVYVTGSFRDYICFDSLCFNAASQDTTDIFLAKYDSTGKVVWAKVFGGRGIDEGEELALDSKGNIFLAAEFTREIHLGGHTIIANDPNFYLHQPPDFFVAKFSPDGEVLHTLDTDGTTFAKIHEIACDKNDNLIIAGMSGSGSLIFNQDIFIAGIGRPQLFIVKLDTSLKAKYVRIITINDGGRIENLVSDNEGRIYLTGYFGDSMVVDNQILTSENTSHNFILQLDENMDYAWSELFTKAQIRGVAIDDKDDLYFVGEMSGEFYFDSIYIENAKKVFFLIKSNSEGHALWIKKSTLGFPHDIDITYYRGQVYAAFPFRYSFIIEEIEFRPEKRIEILIIRYDTTGNFIWARLAGSESDYWPIHLDGNSNGSIVVGSMFNYNATYFDSALIWNTFPSFMEPFIAKLEADSIPPLPILPPNWIIYPNPVADRLTVSGEFEPGELFFQLFDLSGRKVWKRTIAIDQEIQKTMKFPHLPSGMYILMARQGDKVEVFKLLKE